MIFYALIFILSFILTYVVKRVAVKKMLVDIPNERSSHDIPTPRGGGLAIILTWFGSISYLHFFEGVQPNLYYALISGVLISIISFLDDIYTLKSLPRILVQAITTIAALYFVGGLQEIDFGFIVIQNAILLNVIAFFGVVWFINLYNFIDGINGYSSSGALFFALSLFCFVNDYLLLAFAASILGFIPWNWGKAKIFMGDIGSTILGFTVAVLLVFYNNNGELSIFNGLVLTSVYWFDATITLLRRFINKEKITQPHKKHAYQRAVQSGWSHQATTLGVLLINTLLFALVYFSTFHPGINLIIAIVFLLVIYFLVETRKAFE